MNLNSSLIVLISLITISSISGNDCGDPKGLNSWAVGVLRNGNLNCEGSLISPDVVLTSAKCVFRSKKPYNSLKILPNWKGRSEVESGFEISVEDVIIHPLFNKRSLNNDLALLRLSNKLELNPICLPQGPGEDYSEDLERPGRNVTYSGFDVSSDDGHSIEVKSRSWVSSILSNEECLEFHGSRFTGNGMLCVQDLPRLNGPENCNENFGGPLFTETRRGEDHFTQIGIYSWGFSCNDVSKRVFTRISEYVPWIRKHLE